MAGEVDPEDAAYVCSLSAHSLAVARAELGEDPSHRLGAVSTLRQWIRDQPHIRSRTDTAWLLMFLRGAKFSQLRARQILLSTLELMTATPQWFRDIDTLSPGVMEYLSVGVAVPLPKRDKFNRRIVLLRPGAISTRSPHFPLEHEVQVGFATGLAVRAEETTQIHGFILLFDFTGYSMKHLARYSPESLKKQLKMFQDGIPGRVKVYHVYNSGAMFEAMMAMSRPFLKRKMADRIKAHSNLDSIYKEIDRELLPKEYLPEDYKGPNAGSLQDLIDSVTNQVTSHAFRQEVLLTTSDQFGVDKSPKTNSALGASYRKLSVD